MFYGPVKEDLGGVTFLFVEKVLEHSSKVLIIGLLFEF